MPLHRRQHDPVLIKGQVEIVTRLDADLRQNQLWITRKPLIAVNFHSAPLFNFGRVSEL